MTKKTKGKTEATIKLDPPPPPWGELALQHTSYLLKDLTRLHQKYIRSFVKSHPVIVVKNEGTHTVVGQYRSWRLQQILGEPGQVIVRKDEVLLLDVPPKTIGDVAGTNLFMEGLIGTLGRASELWYLLMIYKTLPRVVARSILPGVTTDAQFASLLGFSRSALHQNKPASPVAN